MEEIEHYQSDIIKLLGVDLLRKGDWPENIRSVKGKTERNELHAMASENFERKSSILSGCPADYGLLDEETDTCTRGR